MLVKNFPKVTMSLYHINTSGQPCPLESALSRGSIRDQFLSTSSRAVCVVTAACKTSSIELYAVYMLAKELYPGKFRPTLTHSFVQLLSSKSLLHTCFTQNIDTLERRAGVPANKIIEAHGSFASQRCIECRKPYDDEKMKKAVLKGDIPRCENVHCKGTGKTKRNLNGEEEKERGLVKPDIVFFGEGVSCTC